MDSMGRATRESLRWAQEKLLLLRMEVVGEVGRAGVIVAVWVVVAGATVQLVRTHRRILPVVAFLRPRGEESVAAKISPMMSWCGAAGEVAGLVIIV